MAELKINPVYKVGSRELRSGNTIISFEVDETAAAQLLPYHLLKQDQPLNLTIVDGEAPTKDPVDERRNKLYARIEILVNECGLDEEKKRLFFNSVVGKLSKQEMSLDELDTLEKSLYVEANPIAEEV